MTEVTLEGITADLRCLADEARAAGDYDAAVKAVKWIGRFHGLYVERRLIMHQGMMEEDAINVLADGDTLFEETLRRLLMARKRSQHLQPVN